MNRRGWLGMMAGLFGLGVSRAVAEPVVNASDWPEGSGTEYDYMSPLLLNPKSDLGYWFCKGELRIVEEADGMTAQLMQKWVHTKTGAIEWRPVLIEKHTTQSE